MPNTQPVYFFSHGSPMNAIENNRFTADWLKLYQNSQATALVIFSAHWHVPGIRITSAKKLATIHDFHGFPDLLHQQDYPAITASDTASEINSLLNSHGYNVMLDESWGLDHGSWSLLKHLQPKADIPVIQISLNNQEKDAQWHYDMAKTLKPLRDKGIVFIGSGGIVHNISKWMHSRAGDPINWAKDFDNAIAQAVDQRDINTLVNYQQLPFARDAVPTIEHYLPLIYCQALSDDNDIIQHSPIALEDNKDLASYCSRSIRFSRF